MTMSSALRKLPTLWLDSRDRDRKNDVGAGAESSELPKNNSKSDLEIVMGELSRDTSLEGNEWRARTSNIQHEQERDIAVQSPRRYHRDREKLHSTARRTDTPACLTSCRLSSVHATYAEIGAARCIGDCGLLVFRLVILSVLGISAGVSFSVRDTVPISCLLTELFIWLHALHLLLIPFLLVTSLMAANIPSDESGEGQRPLGGSIWTVVSTASHVAHSFSQFELIRLFVLHSVPSLQPFKSATETNDIFSLRSIFAVQRYIMAGFSVTELLFSKAPHHFLHTAMVLVLSMCWEICMYLLRVLEKTVGVRVGLLIGSVALAVGLSALNVIAQRALEGYSSDPSLNDDGLRKIMDIV